MIKYFRVNNLREWDFALDSLHKLGYRWISGANLSKVKYHEYFTDEGRNYISFSTGMEVGASLLLNSNSPLIVPNPFKVEEELE